MKSLKIPLMQLIIVNEKEVKEINYSYRVGNTSH